MIRLNTRTRFAVFGMIGLAGISSFGAVQAAHAGTSLGTPGDLNAVSLLTPTFGVESSQPFTPLQSALARIARFEDGEGSSVTDGAAATGRLRSWELPAVQVVGEEGSGLREEDLVGSYHQPRWTATRRFPTTRVYVIPEGKVEVELWARGTFKDGEADWRLLQEIEIGLPYRLQLDIYLRQDYDSATDDTQWGAQFEIRWAFADWGEIWGNPTIYLEYVLLDERPDKFEPKLLLGGEIAQGWHWAFNFVGEFELGGEREYEYALTSAVAYSVIDSVLSIGVENILTLTDVAGNRGDYSVSFVIGPSIQWHPVPAMTINIAPLFGVTDESPDAQLWCNFGWEF